MLEVTLAILFVILVGWYYYLKRFHGILESTGIPVIPPYYCFSSEPWPTQKLQFHKWYLKKHMELGMTFGRYDGVKPTICTIDPELIKEITVKQFENFMDVFDVNFKPHQTTLDVSRGEVWRGLRKLLTPTFSSGKLKSMVEPIDKIADEVLDFIEQEIENKGDEMNLVPIIQGFNLDSMAKVNYGIETKCYKGENEELLEKARDVTKEFAMDSLVPQLFFLIMSHFPFLFSQLGFWPESALFFGKLAKDITEERDKKNVQFGDYIDRIRELKKVAKPPITPEILDAQGVIFILAGFETMSNVMGSFVYFLARNPEIQERIFEEITENIGEDEGINHESISKLEYLEASLMETMRMCPPATGHLRACTRDCVVKGIKFQKGMSVAMWSYASHYYPKFYPDPEVFKPERFLKENSDQVIPFTWRPFGSGQRVCIGQRYAMVGMKLFMAKFIAKFKLLPTEKTKLEYPTPNGFLLISYKESVAKIEKRQ